MVPRCVMYHILYIIYGVNYVQCIRTWCVLVYIIEQGILRGNKKILLCGGAT